MLTDARSQLLQFSSTTVFLCPFSRHLHSFWTSVLGFLKSLTNIISSIKFIPALNWSSFPKKAIHIALPDPTQLNQTETFIYYTLKSSLLLYDYSSSSNSCIGLSYIPSLLYFAQLWSFPTNISNFSSPRKITFALFVWQFPAVRLLLLSMSNLPTNTPLTFPLEQSCSPVFPACHLSPEFINFWTLYFMLWTCALVNRTLK